MPKSSIGLQIGALLLNNFCEAELTIIPMKLTIEKPSGTANNWGSFAAPGVFARDAKSGAFVTRVAMLEIHDIRLETMAHPSADPCKVPGS